MSDWKKTLALAAGLVLGTVIGFAARPAAMRFLGSLMEDRSDYDSEYEPRDW